jgi:predicted transcriptional regulator
MGIVFDTGEDGFRTVVKDYQEMALRFIWGSGERGSKEVWLHVNKELGGSESISRASIINFLNAMVDEGALSYTEITGKGGHRRIYSPPLDEEGFKRYVAKNVIAKLFETWPDATKEAIETLIGDNG